MTALETILKAQISAQGPMSVAQFMSLCLLHPKHGYYSTRDPLGTGGDFITAPEISQMFGELIGLCLAQVWIDQGQAAKVALVELGPGRGTLMADILRTIRAVPGFAAACDVHLIEASPHLRAAQKNTLTGYIPTWHDSVATLPDDQPIYCAANEFFDALPIRQMIRNGDGWRERMIGLEGDTLSFGLSEVAPLDALAHRLEDTKDGDLVEHCPAASAIMQTLGARIEANGGAALIFDYGDWRSLGDTLQAVRDHEMVDPLHRPGQSDLSAHVDFEALIADLHCHHSRLTLQGIFLERLGITQRAQALAKSLSGPALDQHIAAHKRLTHADEMGTIFKTLALFPEGANPPAGYET
ncbi:class I SAM-dependent methyltransferase [Planktotalea arctica]|uniref:class I SAM-dependent methyltransferase n=1 Tax=Planktotalea arctica TaxID=1481893 RepID=UPI000A170440|nr:SAM-dependent methyltransferase [Planktotalea arctica]